MQHQKKKKEDGLSSSNCHFAEIFAKENLFHTKYPEKDGLSR